MSTTATGATESALKSAWWVLIGSAVAIASVVLTQLSALLGRLVVDDGPAFPLTSIIRPRFTITDSDPIMRALSTWVGLSPDRVELTRFVIDWHVRLDTLVLVPAVGFMLYRWLRTDTNVLIRRLAVGVYLVADLGENWCLWRVASDLSVPLSNDPGLEVRILPTLSLLKWGALVVGIVVGGVANRGRARLLQRVVAPIRAAVVVTLFTVALLAVPGGDPLEQLPDVVRAQVLPGPEGTLWETLTASAFLVPLFACLTLALATFVASECTVRHLQTNGTSDIPRSLVGMAAAVAFGAAALVAAWVALPQHGFTVTAGTSAAVALLTFFGVALAMGRGAGSGAADDYDGQTVRHIRNVALACCCSIAGAFGLSMIRAFTELAIGAQGRFPVENAAAATAALAVGLVLALVLPLMVIALSKAMSLLSGDSDLRALTGLLLANTSALAFWLATAAARPADALQPQGVVFTCMGILVLSWSLIDVSPRVYRSGAWLGALRIERRPVGLALLTLLIVPSMLNQTVGYHAVQRELAGGQAAPEGSPDGTESTCVTDPWPCHLEAWASNLEACIAKVDGIRDDHPLPLVLVAAPGGGIRAAYWTALGLDAIARQPCGREMTFAISGVSGGSVGATTWVGLGGRGKDYGVEADEISASMQVARMGGTGPLSRDLAAMLFRDLPIGLSGLHPPMGDRAELLEDAWEAEAPQLASTLEALRGDGAWQPHLLLNATDVQRGCRVLATTLPELMTAPLGTVKSGVVEIDPRRCASTTDRIPNIAVSGNRPPNAFAVGTTDVRYISTATEPCANSASEVQDLPASAAAHLSARFPIVSPSGGFVVCRPQGKLMGSPDHDQVQVGDGGYRDNTGLSTLLEMWRTLSPAVQAHNAHRGQRPITPTIVLLDNHYRFATQADSPGRLGELRVPLSGMSARQHLGSEPVLEQTALDTMAAAQLKAPDADTLGQRTCVGWLVIAPRTSISVTAPLGWVLSSQSRASLRTELKTAGRKLDVLGHCAAGDRLPLPSDDPFN